MKKKQLLTDKSSDLQEQLIDDAAKRLSNEIDFEILCGMLCELGWTKVVLFPMSWENGVLIDQWVETNIKSNFETMGLVWIFEDSKDANWFKLRWLS